MARVAARALDDSDDSAVADLVHRIAVAMTKAEIALWWRCTQRAVEVAVVAVVTVEIEAAVIGRCHGGGGDVFGRSGCSGDGAGATGAGGKVDIVTFKSDGGAGEVGGAGHG